MNEAQRQQLESVIVQSRTFRANPEWHFVFIENPEILNPLLELIPGLEGVTAEDAVLAFAASGSMGARADASAALYRVYCTAENPAGRFCEPLTMYFNIPQGQRIAAAFGVPEGYVCTGALLFSGTPEPENHSEEIKWDVFSCIR